MGCSAPSAGWATVARRRLGLGLAGSTTLARSAAKKLRDPPRATSVETWAFVALPTLGKSTTVEAISTMLRVGTGTAPPPESEAEAIGTHRPRTPQSRQHFETCEQPALRFEPYEVPSSKPTTYSARNSVIEGKTSPNYRQHQRQQSAPSFPARRLNAPSLPPPSQGHDNKTLAQNMALTGDRRGGNSPGRFGGRRSGASTLSVEHDTTTPSVSHQTRSPGVDTTPKSATQSRLGFLASSVTAFTSRMTSPTQPSPARTDDELCDLDIEAALFPASPPSPLDSKGEAFSPAAYKNLQANATGLLHRMQDAYRQRTAALRELQAEREAQGEEMGGFQLGSTIVLVFEAPVADQAGSKRGFTWAVEKGQKIKMGQALGHVEE
ncbi:hypothetical protein CHU98_g5394 [Xylaria longipes]|nr:hypothetical protein CHU98_g5394 [Xylaria longipes]